MRLRNQKKKKKLTSQQVASAGVEKDRTRHADDSAITQSKTLTRQTNKQTTLTTFRRLNLNSGASEINVNHKLNGPININSQYTKSQWHRLLDIV